MDVECKLKEIRYNQNIVLKVGIFKQEKIKGWKKDLKPLAGIKVNKMSSNYWLDKNGKNPSTADFFSSIWKRTNIEKQFEIVWGQKADKLIQQALTTGKEVQATNSLRALMKQAYMRMSKSSKNSLNRIAQKKHSNFAFGTGQTYKAIHSQIKYNSRKVNADEINNE